MKREIDLTPYIPAIMDYAEKTSERDFLILSALGEGGFRRGEAVGNKDRREIWPVEMFERAKKKSEIPHRKAILASLFSGSPKFEDETGSYELIRDGQFVKRMRPEDPLPGLLVTDLHDGSIWVRGKGGTEKEQPLPSKLYARLQAYIGKRKSGKIFDLGSEGLYKMVRRYAQRAGVGEWDKVHPHRFRHYYIRSVYRKTKDPVMTQALARHKDFNMTNHYIGEPEMADKKAVVESLA